MVQVAESTGARDGEQKMWSRAGRVESEPVTPASSASSSQKSTCLRRKKKSRSCGMDSDGDVRMETSSQESEWEVTKRLDFDDMELSGDGPNDERLPEIVCMEKQRRMPKSPRAAVTTREKKATTARANGPIRNTCILESPLDHKRSTRKRRVYGVRRAESDKHRNIGSTRGIPFAICSLQRMFAP